MGGRSAASLPSEVLSALKTAGLAGAAESPGGEPLAGGVSSDIWRVDLARGPVCVKRALSRLRVAQTWEAPVERNIYEYRWLQTATAALPGCTPMPIAQAKGVLVMEYLEPAQHPVWKALLRQGKADPEFAASVGRSLARIHAATADQASVRDAFSTDAIFFAIRLEPYLVATSKVHPALEYALLSLVERTAKTRLCLVHGDVSPKNILVGPRGPVFLDAECAWYGDPAFDLAFCLNHLLLKCLWTPGASGLFLDCFGALKDSYFAAADWEEAAELESRTASLLPALLLARIDGKSPVEYVTDEAQKELVRCMASPLIL
ncbi:MAG: aminoglycoside phosphotransferase family protein, partial [Betaproteobacteria bacterium]|nr:aminoglycoside phosphotransferase family protein [Betaproteobacteria bacterium]